VPILFATSPLAAMRSEPTITHDTPPRAMHAAAALSAINLTGIASRTSSQAVNRAP